MRRPASSPPSLPRPSLRELSQWASGALVILSGWGAGRGLAVGMDTAHCAATGFAISGSIFLAVLLCGAPAQKRGSARG